MMRIKQGDPKIEHSRLRGQGRRWQGWHAPQADPRPSPVPEAIQLADLIPHRIKGSHHNVRGAGVSSARCGRCA